MAIGRAAAWLGIGAAGLYGAGSAIMDEQGPYGDLAENVLGSRQAVRAVVSSAAANTFSSDHDMMESIERRDDGTMARMHHRHRYYHGGHVSSSSPATAPIGSHLRGEVDGSIVWGMNNLRRGGH